MSRLTETDSQGNWALSGVAWKSLYAGQVITDGMWEKDLRRIVEAYGV